MTTMQHTQERTAAPSKRQLLMQSISIAPSKHKQATDAMKAHRTANKGAVTETAYTMQLQEGSTGCSARAAQMDGSRHCRL
jgi:hypothetical protein